MPKEKKIAVIVAPHPDDEILGCYKVLKENSCVIIYTEDISIERKEEVQNIKEDFKIKAQLFLRSIPSHMLTDEYTFYMPDPIYETHPAHRAQGQIGESMARNGLDVIFYSTNMQAPYVHEVKDSDKKEEILNKCYPSQKSLWEYEKKYILFEGYSKWLF